MICVIPAASALAPIQTISKNALWPKLPAAQNASSTSTAPMISWPHQSSRPRSYRATTMLKTPAKSR